MVEFGDDWAPARMVAGDLAGLRDALSSAGEIEAVLDPRLGAPGHPLPEALTKLAPTRPWRVRTAPWREVVVGTLVAERTSDAPPGYAADSLTLREVPVTTAVVVGEAPLELSAWRALPAASVGSCEPLFEALALAQEQSLAFVEPFLDHADTALRLRFRAGLAQVLPQLRADVEPFADPEPPADHRPRERDVHACGHALYRRVQEAAICLEETRCSIAPRLVLRGGTHVAMPAPPWSPEACRGQLDVEARLQAVATEAAVATVSTLEPHWVTLVDRVAAMGTVYEAMTDLCSARRRRFAAVDLDDARARLERIERALGTDALDESGRWDVELGALFVPGVGPSVTLASFVSAESGAAQTAVAEAVGVRRFLLSRSLCRSGYAELPLAVAVFEPGSAQASFAGWFYEETLACADLPPPVP